MRRLKFNLKLSTIIWIFIVACSTLPKHQDYNGTYLLTASGFGEGTLILKRSKDAYNVTCINNDPNSKDTAFVSGIIIHQNNLVFEFDSVLPDSAVINFNFDINIQEDNLSGTVSVSPFGAFNISGYKM